MTNIKANEKRDKILKIMREKADGFNSIGDLVFYLQNDCNIQISQRTIQNYINRYNIQLGIKKEEIVIGGTENKQKFNRKKLIKKISKMFIEGYTLSEIQKDLKIASGVIQNVLYTKNPMNDGKENIANYIKEQLLDYIGLEIFASFRRDLDKLIKQDQNVNIVKDGLIMAIHSLTQKLIEDIKNDNISNNLNLERRIELLSKSFKHLDGNKNRKELVSILDKFNRYNTETEMDVKGTELIISNHEKINEMLERIKDEETKREKELKGEIIDLEEDKE